ncbi:MAG: UV DNA damage repair endonuclease UvsE [Clostridiaceae bacterium]|nr:UV DNA damage repair endonuclease UvsE [Clostridiaceae bacterium]
MRVRLGYVAISKKLGPKVTSSSTVTYKNYSKLTSEQIKKDKLKSITLSNLNDLTTIIKYNIENDLHFYRITSALIPLATHPDVGYWGHREIFNKDYAYIGELIKEANMRVDTHPDQFNVINSTNEEVVKNTITSLLHQSELFQDLNYKNGKMVIHVGGAAGGKDSGLERFIENFRKLPSEIKEKLIIENDDKIYTATDVLYLCSVLNVPMVLDVHHHNCNNDGEDIEEFLPKVFDTWKNECLPPKLHFSSPRNGEKDRKHADYINADDFVAFLEKAKVLDQDFDIMLECKEKDLALYQLAKDIKEIKPQYKWLDSSSFIV